jgi:hypothetical protein
MRWMAEPVASLIDEAWRNANQPSTSGASRIFVLVVSSASDDRLVLELRRLVWPLDG